MNVDSMERIVPDELQAGTTGSTTLEFHLERYRFASKFIKNGNVLDIACGVGYGTALLATGKNVNELIGVDISKDAISYAQKRYDNEKINFVASDAMSFEASNKFDYIVSLETIEHLPQPNLFIQKMKSQLKSGGIFIASVPITPSVDANPHHLTDFSQKSFKKIFSDLGFVELDSLLQIQSYSPFQVAARTEPRMENMRKNLLQYYLQNPKSAFKRITSIVKDGFNNKYLTVAWQLR